MKLSRYLWLLICGFFFVRMALFMSYPFLALHLSVLDFSAIDIGIILGSHYFFASFIGAIGANASDRFHPKKIVILNLSTSSIAFIGLAFSTSFFHFLICNILLAVSTAIFEPTATTIIAKSVSSELHSILLRFRYLAINAGAVIGPLLGALFLPLGFRLSFVGTSLLIILYLTVFMSVKPVKMNTERGENERRVDLRMVFNHMRRNTPFLFLMGANLCLTMTYSQIFSTFPQIIKSISGNESHLYHAMIITNPISVIILGLFLTRLLSKQKSKPLLLIGSLLLCFVFVGYGFCSFSYLNCIGLMVLFSFAEMLLIPTTTKYLIDLAPIEFRRSYLGSESWSYLGFFMGNFAGGWLLQSGMSVFLFCSILCLSGFFLYLLSFKFHMKRGSSQDAETVMLNI